jgi:hypothetical protein
MTVRSSSLAVLILLAFRGLAQQTIFEVASVKPSQPDARGSTFQFTPGGGVTVKNADLRGILEMAYDVRDFQISGGPGWLDSERYDIFAKSASGDPRAGTKLAEVNVADVAAGSSSGIQAGCGQMRNNSD